MSRRAARLAAALAAAAAAVAGAGLAGLTPPGLLAAAPAGAQEQSPLVIGSVDVSAYPEVTAVVTTPGGLEGVGYPPDAFTVLEGDQPMDVAVERVPAAGLEVMLVLDTSGSMEDEPLTAATDAARAFVAVLPPEVRVGLVAFGPAPATVVPPTPNRDAVSFGLAGLTAAGETALYDAVSHAAGEFSPEATDRAIVLLSDGGDTASRETLDQAVAAAAGVPINVIDLVTPESNRAALDRLAEGGGTVSRATDPDGLASLYQATARALVNRYRVSYTSEARGPVELTVRVATSGGVIGQTKTVEMPGTAAAGGDGSSLDTSGSAPAADGGGLAAQWGLPVGAAAMFVALVLLGRALLPDQRQVRVAALRAGRTASATVQTAPSVSEVTQRMAAAADAFLERRGRRQSLAAALEVADIALRTGEFTVLVAAATLITALLGLLFAGLLGLLTGLVLAPLAAGAFVSRKVRVRRERFADQLPDTLQLLSGTLRSGYGLLQALDSVAREAPEPNRAEFGRVLVEIRVGRDPSAALHALAERMRSEDFDWVVGAVDINREVGGDLAQVLDNVGDTIRERQRLFRQMRALTAEGRLSAYILTALPPCLMVALAILNPDYISGLTSGFGLVLLAVAAGMLTVGWIWMQRLIRLEF